MGCFSQSFLLIDTISQPSENQDECLGPSENQDEFAWGRVKTKTITSRAEWKIRFPQSFRALILLIWSGHWLSPLLTNFLTWVSSSWLSWSPLCLAGFSLYRTVTYSIYKLSLSSFTLNFRLLLSIAPPGCRNTWALRDSTPLSVQLEQVLPVYHPCPGI